MDQVYQHHPNQNNHSTWTHSPGIQYFLTGQFPPYSPHKDLSIYGLRVFSRPMNKEFFSLFSVPWIDHYSTPRLPWTVVVFVTHCRWFVNGLEIIVKKNTIYLKLIQFVHIFEAEYSVFYRYSEEFRPFGSNFKNIVFFIVLISKPLTHRWQWVEKPITVHGNCGVNIQTVDTSIQSSL